MTEQEIKAMCKLAVEHSNYPLTDLDKELLKQAIDKAKNAQEMVAAVLILLNNMQQQNVFLRRNYNQTYGVNNG